MEQNKTVFVGSSSKFIPPESVKDTIKKSLECFLHCL